MTNGRARHRDEASTDALGEFQELGGKFQKRLPHSSDIHDEVASVLRRGDQRHGGRHHDNFTSAQFENFLDFVACRTTRRDEDGAVLHSSAELLYSLVRPRLAS